MPSRGRGGRRSKVHVKVELGATRRPRQWRITRLALGRGDVTDVTECYQERPKRRFLTAEAALEEARRRAQTMIQKQFGTVSSDDVIWEITPPQRECPPVVPA